MVGKCIKKSEYLKVNNNYIILQIVDSKAEVIDDTMESCWYDIDYFEIKDCSICSNNKECDDNHFSRKQYYCMLNGYRDFKYIKQECETC